MRSPESNFTSDCSVLEWLCSDRIALIVVLSKWVLRPHFHGLTSYGLLNSFGAERKWKRIMRSNLTCDELCSLSISISYSTFNVDSLPLFHANQTITHVLSRRMQRKSKEEQHHRVFRACVLSKWHLLEYTVCFRLSAYRPPTLTNSAGARGQHRCTPVRRTQINDKGRNKMVLCLPLAINEEK